MNTDLTELLTSQVKNLTASAIVDVEIDICPNNNNSIILVCDEKYKNQVKVCFSSGNLKVGAEGSFNNAGSMKIILRASSLEEIISSGTSYISGLYKGSNLKIKVTGTGDVNLSGTVRDLDVSILGTGNASLKGLEARNVTLKLSGTSDANVFASNSCSVTISGIGNATVYGKPEKMKQKVSGLGSVKQAGSNKKSIESAFEMPVFGANIFDNTFSSNIFKSNDFTQEKAHKEAERDKIQQDKDQELDAKLYLKRIEVEMKMKMQDLQNNYFNKATENFGENEETADKKSATARLKAKFKGLL